MCRKKNYFFSKCIIKSEWVGKILRDRKTFFKKIISETVHSHRKIQNLESENTFWDASQSM